MKFLCLHSIWKYDFWNPHIHHWHPRFSCLLSDIFHWVNRIFAFNPHLLPVLEGESESSPLTFLVGVGVLLRMTVRVLAFLSMRWQINSTCSRRSLLAATGMSPGSHLWCGLHETLHIFGAKTIWIWPTKKNINHQKQCSSPWLGFMSLNLKNNWLTSAFSQTHVLPNTLYIYKQFCRILSGQTFVGSEHPGYCYWSQIQVAWVRSCWFVAGQALLSSYECYAGRESHGNPYIPHFCCWNPDFFVAC